jgi:hypothetical protein
MADLIYTKVGLPNTCSMCGESVSREEGWYAPNDDVARSGGGICKKDYEAMQTAEPPASTNTAPPQEQKEPTPSGSVTAPVAAAPIEDAKEMPTPSRRTAARKPATDKAAKPRASRKKQTQTQTHK